MSNPTDPSAPIRYPEVYNPLQPSAPPPEANPLPEVPVKPSPEVKAPAATPGFFSRIWSFLFPPGEDSSPEEQVKVQARKIDELAKALLEVQDRAAQLQGLNYTLGQEKTEGDNRYGKLLLDKALLNEKMANLQAERDRLETEKNRDSQLLQQTLQAFETTKKELAIRGAVEKDSAAARLQRTESDFKEENAALVTKNKLLVEQASTLERKVLAMNTNLERLRSQYADFALAIKDFKERQGQIATATKEQEVALQHLVTLVGSSVPPSEKPKP